ncbi:hypothetical protein N7517_005431 [Penicillium concentricum]|uniref:Extracellular membrane protein CFEM domain-containing protein n=1 Tax=Penicillium concentricum TaxID=293559 RepID=A0A9W9S8N2_9EURO|nr:uncharacterized protein N7517_005431 [Penicillium concentricum]KAJ5373425.1 hypothetical protein N7517_005431 [Penicillium concentricum]
MLFNKSIFAVAVMALANVVTATTVQTPACVLKIIGNQANPADSKAICGSNASKIQADISKNCADSEASLKFFASNCAQLGHKVVTVSTTSTGTSESSTATGFVTAVSSGTVTGAIATKTGSSAATGTGSGSSPAATGTGASTGTASGSGSAASPSSTFNAASSDRQFSATTFVAAIFLGAAALL